MPTENLYLNIVKKNFEELLNHLKNKNVNFKKIHSILIGDSEFILTNTGEFIRKENIQSRHPKYIIALPQKAAFNFSINWKAENHPIKISIEKSLERSWEWPKGIYIPKNSKKSLNFIKIIRVCIKIFSIKEIENKLYYDDASEVEFEEIFGYFKYLILLESHLADIKSYKNLNNHCEKITSLLKELSKDLERYKDDQNKIQNLIEKIEDITKKLKTFEIEIFLNEIENLTKEIYEFYEGNRDLND